MKNLRTKINTIFTGKYLKYWYAACAVFILTMALSFHKNKAVEQYQLTIFNNDGSVAEQRTVSRNELPYVNDVLPVNKSYKPLK